MFAETPGNLPSVSLPQSASWLQLSAGVGGPPPPALPFGTCHGFWFLLVPQHFSTPAHTSVNLDIISPLYSLY